MHGNQPHPATPISDAAFIINRGKKRGDYRCGRCGVPKKGHNCPLATKADDGSTPVSTPAAVTITSAVGIANLAVDTPISVVRSVPPPCRRRALSFDDVSLACEEQEDDVDQEVDLESSKLPANCLWGIFRRLTPADLLRAAPVCRGWRDTTRRIWRATEELRLRVPVNAQIGLVGSVLQKCPELVKLSLRMESDVDATILACIAFSCRNLQSLEILSSGSSSNRINGDELSRFIAEKRCLTSLKIEGCSNLGSFVFSSSSLSTVWLSDLHSVSKMVFHCPNLKEISLDFCPQENDCTDLAAAVDVLGRCCPKIQNIHIASVQLSHSVVLALADANLRGLRMLSLVLGSGITDASVAAIASNYSRLELLDLSGSSISDSGIGIICNVFPETLSKLLLALCPNITSSGIQFATAQLPRLELMDCGMTICDIDPNSDESFDNEECYELNRTPNKLHLIFQKLIIKHSRLKKLSLWGCSGLDGLYLNCPNLNDLNLNCCRNLHPERLLLQCPNLANVHASDCKHMLVQTIETQVSNDFSDVENNYPLKRLPDGSKRVRVPYFCPMPYNDEKKRRMSVKRQCSVIS